MLSDAFNSLDYVNGRFNLTLDQAKALRLGTSTDGVEPRLSVPFHNPKRQVIAMQYRSLNADSAMRWTSEKNPEGEAWSRIGYFAGKDESMVLLTEGPSDALTAVGCGYSAICVRGAAMLDRATAEMIREWVGEREVVIVPDGDDAGFRFQTSIVRLRMHRNIMNLCVNVIGFQMVINFLSVV